MKKFLSSLFFLLPALAFSQTLTVQEQKRCVAFDVLQNMRKLNPNMETDQQFEQWLSEKKQQMRTSNTQAVVTLPIVFHIIYSPSEAEGTGTNIGQALIQQQILQLNKDYANLSNSPYAIASNTNVQFALAQKDPLGNILPQPGIDRINYSTAGFTAPPYTVGYASSANNYLNSTIKPATIWDPTRYINIWVLSMESGILGIATFPASSGLSGLSGAETSTTSGVAIGPTTIGSIFTPSSCSAYTKGKTLTHELGHFFGLRHIWGDATCGDDFCGDTPIHQTSNGGVPAHPKSNTCGTADEMFENYMDYTDDAILNTFTADQVTRIQTVLANSPRRNTLATSNVGLVPVTATNRISFSECSGAMVVSESGIAGSYPRYRDLPLTLNVEDKATGNATVTVNVSGTAVNGVDYQLLTPTISFAAGDNYKPLNIRVIDNAKVDGNRTIVITYTISGTGVVAGTSSQTMTITIQDNDDMFVSQGSATVYAENFNGAISGWSTLNFSASPVNTFVISANGNAGGTGAVLHVTNDPVAKPNTYTKTVASSSGVRMPLLSVMNMANAQLSFKYRVNGQSSTTDYARVIYATESSPSSYAFLGSTLVGTGAVGGNVSGTATIPLTNSTFANNKVYLGFYWTNNTTSGNDDPLNVDDITITADGTNVETAVSSSFGYDIQSGSSINNFRSTNNKAIARLTNLSENVTGITASVIATGSAQASITTSTGTFSRTEKVFQITPTVANTTASYRVTLYFTSAELAVWGGNKLLLKVLKVKDGASLTGPINSGNAIAVTPVSATEDAAAGVIAYTADFTGGFSQFMLVSPTFTLPVGLVNFDVVAGKKTIDLSWKTAAERNNKGFEIERSTNGVDFVNIGWVGGAGTTNDPSFYRFTDNFVQPNTVYYYRLKQVDFDSRATLSNTRQAKIVANGIEITVSPNPARNQIRVFAAGITQPTDISLVNAKGQTVGKWQNADISSTYPINVSRFAKGYYTLTIHLADGDVSRQILIQ